MNNVRQEQPSEDFADSEELHRISDTKTAMRKGLRTLAVVFGGFLIWASFAPLDEGVPTPGLVSVATKRKPIQHLTGGILDDVLVREGQFVKSGQVLARINNADARANFEAARQHFMGLRAMEARLVAEQVGADEVAFPDELLNTADPMVQQQIATQRSLFFSRRSALDAQVSAMTEAIMGQRAMIEAYKSELESRREQYDSIRDDLNGVSGLVAEGYLPMARERELRRQLAGTRGAISELTGNISRTQRTIAEMQRKITQANQDFRAQGEGQLAGIRLEIQADREKFRAASDDLNRTVIRSPVDGQGVGLLVQSKGAVVQPAQKIMDIVPNNEELVVETKIPPHLADRVKKGQFTELQFSNFANSPAVTVDGRVRSVSKDLIYEQSGTGVTAYYAAQVIVTRDGLRKLGSRQMKPGMPVEVMIKTGQRTLLQYLFKPPTQRLGSAMKEESSCSPQGFSS